MEKLENENDDQIDIFDNDKNDDQIIIEALDKLNSDNQNDLLLNELSECYKTKKKLERIEEKLIKKIYEKFAIKENIDIKEPIDLVYTYIDSNSNNFFINLEITRNNLPFLRNIIIITPTPNIINELYANDNNIFILHIDNIEKYRKSTNLFRANNLLYFLKDLNYLSSIFIYGDSNCIIGKRMKKEDFFDNNLPLIYMSKKTLQEEKINNINIQYSEEYYANKEFEKKFGVFNQLVSINQFNIIRKDAIMMTSRLSGKYTTSIDYLVLQYLIGYYFKLYNIQIINNKQLNMQIPYECFNIINNYSYFNNINNKITPYYVKWGLINLGIINNTHINTIYIYGQKIKYIIPFLEKELIGIKLVYLSKLEKNRGKIGDNIFISDIDEKIEVDTILIKINRTYLTQIIPDILFFCNIYIPHKKEYEYSLKYKEKNNIINIIYPKNVIKNRFFLIKLLGYGNTDNEVFGTIKEGYIHFLSKIKN